MRQKTKDTHRCYTENKINNET
jgi:hypothetical protein